MTKHFWIIIGLVNVTTGLLPPLEIVEEISYIYNTRYAVVYPVPTDDIGSWRYSKVLPTQTIFVTSNMSDNIQPQETKMDLRIFETSASNFLERLDIFKKLFNQRTRVSTEVWLLDIQPWRGQYDSVTALFSDLRLDIDDDLIFYWKKGDNIEMMDCYRIHKDFKPSVRYFNTWNETNGLLEVTSEKWARRRNMEGAHLRVQSMPSNPYVNGMDELGNDTYSFHGMFPDIWHALKETLNFTFTLTKPPDRSWGSLKKNGSWSGMVRQLQLDNSDIAVTDFTVTQARDTVISFAFPVMRVYNSLFLKNPSESYNFKAYTEPVHYAAWIVIILLCLLTPPVMFWTANCGTNEDTSHEFTFGKSYVFVWGSMAMRSWSHIPKTWAARCAFIQFVLAGMWIYWHWEAMLISYLATRVVSLPFNDINEIVTKTNYRIIITPGSANEDFFRYNKDPIFQRAWKERIKPYLEEYKKYNGKNIPAVMENTYSASYGNFIGSSSTWQYFECEVLSPPAKYNYKPYAFGLQKHSPYLGIINHYLKKMRELGSLKKILESYKTKDQICPDYSGQPLGFNSCFTAFIVFLVGLGAGPVILIVEHIAKRLEIKLPSYETMPSELNRVAIMQKKLSLAEAENQALRKKVKHYQTVFGTSTPSLRRRRKHTKIPIEYQS